MVLADGRRGLALGSFLAAVGVASLSISTAGPLGALALSVGGIAAGAGRLRTGPPGWSIMPPGSSPRLVLCVAGGLVALWVGLTVMSGDGGGLRFAVFVMIGLAAARILGSDDAPTVQTAGAVLALAIAGATALAADAPGVAPFVLAAAVAAATGWIPTRGPRAA